MRLCVWASIPVAVLAGGCTHILDARLDDPAAIGSVVDFAQRLQMQTTYPPGRPEPDDVTLTEHKDGFTTYTGRWCVNRTGFNNISDLWERFRMFCDAHGGVLQTGFCSDRTDREKILFLIKLESSERCYRMPRANLFVAEPAGHPPGDAYMALLRTHGYRTSEESRHDRIEQEALRLRLREQELRQMRRIGTRVCRNDIHVQYIGFVEQVEEPKIKISISSARMIQYPGMQPAGFQPTTIWDYPANWRTCE